METGRRHGGRAATRSVGQHVMTLGCPFKMIIRKEKVGMLRYSDLNSEIPISISSFAHIEIGYRSRLSTIFDMFSRRLPLSPCLEYMLLHDAPRTPSLSVYAIQAHSATRSTAPLKNRCFGHLPLPVHPPAATPQAFKYSCTTCQT